MPLSGSNQNAAHAAALRPGGAAGIEALLRQQQELFTSLDALSIQQAELIESAQTDRLLEVLAERQVLIDAIARLNIDIEPWRARWSEFISALSEAERQHIRQCVEAVAALAERIAARDDRDRSLMEARKGAIAAELGNINRGRGAMAAYSSGGPRPESSPRFQDREA
jgi:hypothetical protein